MGFKLPDRTARLVFHGDPDYEGAEVVCRTSVPLEAYLGINDLIEADKVKEAFEFFTKEILVEWNLESEDGTPLPPQGNKGIMPVPLDFAVLIVRGWTKAVLNPSIPLSTVSGNGNMSERELLPVTEN